MSSVPDRSTNEISVARLRLTDDLIFAPQAYGQTTYYHVEVPSQGQFYRVGYAEYVFLSLLDGNRTVAQALTLTARSLGARALSHTEGIQVAHWLIDNGLAQFVDNDSLECYSPRSQSNGLGPLWRHVNPFWMKLSFGSPDRIFTRILPVLGWLFSPWATVAGIFLALVGVGYVASQWTRFTASADAVLAPHNWLWMLLAWLLLKTIHELSHALACKFYGGEVRETGAIFILFAPLAYVDVTSCWRFPSRWQRIHVAAAGMYAELVLAAAAAVAWTYASSPVAQHLLFNVIVMASLSTLLFNANPLMRFDGYYILSDLLKIPNLSQEGRRVLQQRMAQLFFGQKAQPRQILGFRYWVVVGYGFAGAAWRLLICMSLVTAASVLLHGAGLVLAAAGVIAWFGLPLWKVAIAMQRRFHENRPSFLRATVVGIALAATVSGILLWVPWPGAMRAPAVVDYAGHAVIRSATAGFIRRVHVTEGQIVEAGELLVELQNDELATQHRELELALQEDLAQLRLALNRQRGADVQIAQRNVQARKERLREISDQTEGLELRAPVAGRVVARNLAQTVGTYVKRGAEILTVADETRKELVVSVGQEAIDSVMPYVGGETRFRIHGRPARTGTLERLDPRASTRLPHPAMSGRVGGPLAVTEPSEAEANETGMRLVEPRFRGVIAISPQIARQLGAGEQGYAMLGLRQESIGELAWVRFYRWCESLLKPPPKGGRSA